MRVDAESEIGRTEGQTLRRRVGGPSTRRNSDEDVESERATATDGADSRTATTPELAIPGQTRRPSRMSDVCSRLSARLPLASAPCRQVGQAREVRLPGCSRTPDSFRLWQAAVRVHLIEEPAVECGPSGGGRFPWVSPRMEQVGAKPPSEGPLLGGKAVPAGQSANLWGVLRVGTGTRPYGSHVCSSR